MAVVMKSGEVPRYNANERVNHWVVAILFILLAASGLAFFHPAFWFLTGLLGGGTWARILHPFLGVAMFAFFFVMAVRYWQDNIIQPYDREWNKRLVDVMNNRDDNLPAIDKYNIGQKQLFWTMIVTMILLLVSGIILWRPYFAGRRPHARVLRADDRHHRPHVLRHLLGARIDAGDDARHRVPQLGEAPSSPLVQAGDGPVQVVHNPGNP
jgi:formate dehydrogenase gamma subunit